MARKITKIKGNKRSPKHVEQEEDKEEFRSKINLKRTQVEIIDLTRQNTELLVLLTKYKSATRGTWSLTWVS